MPCVIIPWRGDCEHRERAVAFVRERIPYPTHVASVEGEWVKAKAVMPAIRSAPDDVVVIHDADVWCDLHSAVMAICAGAAEWAIPHRRVFRLDREGTEAVYAGEGWEDQPLERRPYEGVWGGGIVVAHRDTFLRAPLDPRFVGWGGEDMALGLALAALAGAPWRGQERLPHLWHPCDRKEHDKLGTLANRALHRRYVHARRSPAAMRALIEETTC